MVAATPGRPDVSSRERASPQTATTATRPGAPGPLVKEIPTSAPRASVTRLRMIRGVDPGGMTPQPAGPSRRRSSPAPRPPASSAAAPVGLPAMSVRPARLSPVTMSPSAKARLPSLTATVAAPSHAPRTAVMVRMPVTA